VDAGGARSLSPVVPLASLACAATAFVAAALGTVWLAPELAGHHYHPRLLALTLRSARWPSRRRSAGCSTT